MNTKRHDGFSPIIRLRNSTANNLQKTANFLNITPSKAVDLAINHWLNLTPTEALGIDAELMISARSIREVSHGS